MKRKVNLTDEYRELIAGRLLGWFLEVNDLDVNAMKNEERQERFKKYALSKIKELKLGIEERDITNLLNKIMCYDNH